MRLIFRTAGFSSAPKWHAWHVDLEIRERVIDRAIVLGILPIPAGGLTRYMRDRRKWLAAIARLPGWGYVDPQKQVQASIAAIEAGLSTWQRELGDLGLDYEEVFQQLAEEHELKEQLGLKLGSEVQSAAIQAAGGRAIRQTMRISPRDGRGSRSMPSRIPAVANAFSRAIWALEPEKLKTISMVV